ncbi:dephospho-CoA kinase, partial [Candidatus Bipolaricaulota bacterium]|nr:dephospho-CoA kinase [Candidatus Bipolaricaulota bacterium]
LAKEIYRPDNPYYEEVIDLLGPEVLRNDGKVDRKKIAELVFENPDLLQRLESLSHPYVSRRIEELIDRYEDEGAELLLIEIPLLFQSSEVNRSKFDRVLLVTVDREEQVKRLVERDGISQSRAERRVELQALPEDARKKAEHVLETDCTREETKRKAVELLSEILN